MKKILLLVVLLIAGSIVPGILIVKRVQFKQNCSGYLKQAADANSTELALQRINMAISYIERESLTDGYTSVLWQTEDENIRFWYENIIACRNELDGCGKASQLEKSNVLMKVRESLTDNDHGDTVLTIPAGIYKYPNNALWSVLLTISIIILCVALFVFVFILHDNGWITD